jgi:hypothetical protein
MNNKWHGLMKVLEIQHLRNGKILYQEKNILNTLHVEGEEFLLSVCFLGLSVPSAYYLGLDNRTTIAASDTLAGITSEPSGGGYVRATATPPGDFSLSLTDAGNNQIISPIVTFRATGAWTTVSNLFLATTSDSSGYLLGSAALSESLNMISGDMVNMRLGLALKDCP